VTEWAKAITVPDAAALVPATLVLPELAA